jgi:hypothetical protein
MGKGKTAKAKYELVDVPVLMPGDAFTFADGGRRHVLARAVFRSGTQAGAWCLPCHRGRAGGHSYNVYVTIGNQVRRYVPRRKA